MPKLTRILLVLSVMAAAWPATAQMTTGTLIGRVVDEQGAAIVAVTVRATNLETGLTRSSESDGAGLYRLAALPVGTYRVVADRRNLRPFERDAVAVNLGSTVALDIVLRVPEITDAVTISATIGRAALRTSSVGEVVDLARIEALPLNGRQFASLAAIVPGVGLGFHSDVSKSAQYAPQISGGNGRNVSYQVDGGDNNDDTNGGLLQLFPLEAIQEFSLITQRFDAEHGRSNGAVLNVVTKSGTNVLRGSGFGLFRDDALNARTQTEKNNTVDKQPYRRYQYGGSLGGPIVRDKTHFFAAYERTQQDTTQVVDTKGLFPDANGVYPIPVRENLFTGKATTVLSPRQWLALRYAWDANSQPSGAGPLAAPSSWSTSTNTFHSVNLNHSWLLGGKALNEIVVQYSSFVNDTPLRNSAPTITSPGRVIGGGTLTSQRTEQTKWQYRDDVSWTASGFGLSHEFRTGVNWIHEPRLFTSTEQAKSGLITLLTENINGPVSQVMQTGGNTSGNIPLDLFGAYIQDNWRVKNRLTMNIGVRWDYLKGLPFNQERNVNFLALQAAGKTGRFEGTLLEDFGKEPRGDKNNLQPRIGAVLDLRGNGRDIVRGGWGIYTDTGFIGANGLLSSWDATGAGGITLSVSNPAGIIKPDGTLFRATDPLSSIATLNQVVPGAPLTTGEALSPRLQQPFSYQTNLGWEHQLGATMSVSADYVRVDGRDLNMRVRPNVLVNGQRYLAGIPITPNNFSFRAATSDGQSRYDALILALRRRMHAGLDVNASYTMAKSTSDVGTASDEIAQNLIQDITNPFGSVQDSPSSRTDARHRITVSAIIRTKWDIQIAPIFFYRSSLPVQTAEGVDLNADGNNNEKTALAYRYTGLDANGRATFETAGACETVNCSRRAPFSQLNLRVSKSFGLSKGTRLEAIAEVFNLYNAKNPFLPITTTRLGGGQPQPSFMQPTAFAGDTGQPEQRVGQLGVRFSF